MDLVRRELKYRITPEQMPAIRDCVRRFCAPDRHTEDGGYRLSSLYFDTPDLRCYHDYLNRQPDRFKLRVRRYDGPAHGLEVKARFGEVFHKTRVELPAGAWPAAFRDPRVLAGRADFDRFHTRLLSLGAVPSVLVRYRREAWTSTVDAYARVTFDHQLTAALPVRDTVPIDDDAADWRPIDATGRFGLDRPALVLELKCERRVPRWMLDLMQRFDLYRQGFSKYATALETVRPQLDVPPVRVPSRRGGRRG